MIVRFEIENQTYKIDASQPFDVSIPLDFYGAQPNVYDVAPAVSQPCEAGSLIGDTRRGGSCNFEEIRLIPHCNGTHTESVGHITRERISIHESLTETFIPARLVTVESVGAFETDETYAVRLDEGDKLITRDALERALQTLNAPHSAPRTPHSLIIRTLPNDAGKKTRRYAEHAPPFFSTEAMRFIVARDVRHLLVDTPSIDRMFDEGKLSNHRIFWNVAPDSFAAAAAEEDSFRRRTITEMIFAPDEIADGFYLLNLQIAPFVADAVPSRPVLFKILD